MTPTTDRADQFDVLLLEVSRRAHELDRLVVPFTDARSARDELQRRLGRVSKAINEDDHLDLHRQLVTLLAHGCRLARDLGVLTETDAVAKDDEHRY
jgi:type II secretory pathway component PulF